MNFIDPDSNDRPAGNRDALPLPSARSVLFAVCGWLRQKFDSLNRALKLPQPFCAHPQVGDSHAVGNNVGCPRNGGEAERFERNVSDPDIESEVGHSVEVDERSICARYGSYAASEAGYVLGDNRRNGDWLFRHGTVPFVGSGSLCVAPYLFYLPLRASRRPLSVNAALRSRGLLLTSWRTTPPRSTPRAMVAADSPIAHRTCHCIGWPQVASYSL